MIDTACIDQYSILGHSDTRHSALSTQHSVPQCSVHRAQSPCLCDVSCHLLVLFGARSRRNSDTDTDTDTDTDEPSVLEARTWSAVHGSRFTVHSSQLRYLRSGMRCRHRSLLACQAPRTFITSLSHFFIFCFIHLTGNHSHSLLRSVEKR